MFDTPVGGSFLLAIIFSLIVFGASILIIMGSIHDAFRRSRGLENFWLDKDPWHNMSAKEVYDEYLNKLENWINSPRLIENPWNSYSHLFRGKGRFVNYHLSPEQYAKELELWNRV